MVKFGINSQLGAKLASIRPFRPFLMSNANMVFFTKRLEKWAETAPPGTQITMDRFVMGAMLGSHDGMISCLREMFGVKPPKQGRIHLVHKIDEKV